MHTLRKYITRSLVVSWKEGIRINNLSNHNSHHVALFCTSNIQLKKDGQGRRGGRNLQNFDDFMQKSKSDWPDEVRAKPAKPLFKNRLAQEILNRRNEVGSDGFFL